MPPKTIATNANGGPPIMVIVVNVTVMERKIIILRPSSPASWLSMATNPCP